MTIRLLKPYAQRPFNAIATFDASVEAGLIAAGQASADLTGGIKYFVPRSALVLQSKQIAVGSVTLKMEEQVTVTLPEGQILSVAGVGAGTVGAASRLGASDTWVISVGSQANVGPFEGMQQILVTCSSGSVVATARDSALAQSGGEAATVTGSAVVGEKLTAALPSGVVGTLQFVRLTKATPPVKTLISGAVANAVNSLQYTYQQGDLIYDIACDASNTVRTSNKISAGGAPITDPAVATAIKLTGPTAVTIGAESSAYTVELSPTGGTVASPVTVTPTDVTGVTFSPASVTLSTASPSGTFTATASTAGTKAIAVTSTGGLTAPAAINLVVATAGTAPAVTSAAAITGTPQQGVPLAITSAAFSGSPTPTVTRVIKMDGVQVASGTQSTTYTPVLADVGKIPSATDTATNGVGSAAISTGAGAAVAAAAAADLFRTATPYNRVATSGASTGAGLTRRMATVKNCGIGSGARKNLKVKIDNVNYLPEGVLLPSLWDATCMGWRGPIMIWQGYQQYAFPEKRQSGLFPGMADRNFG